MIAFTGQELEQSPQLVQFNSEGRTSVGQSFLQISHELHLSVFIYFNIDIFLNASINPPVGHR